MAYRVIKDGNHVYIRGSVQEIKELKKILSSSGKGFSKVRQNPPSLELIDWLNLAGTWISVGLSVATFLYQRLSSKGLAGELKKEIRKALRKPVNKRRKYGADKM